VIEEVDDRTRTYTPEEERFLTTNLRAATIDVDLGAYGGGPFTLQVLCELHRRIFDGVRDHAGKHRQRGYGSEYLSFGPHRSSHRDLVIGEMHHLFQNVKVSIASFDENPEDPNYERGAVHLAVHTHAQVIRTHPFEDGNGRSSRLLMGAILVRLGMRQIPVETCTQEYIATLNHYFTSREIDPLIDLFLSVDAGY
jgi:fido (protein-threonine AMPylation protein)